MNANSVVPAGKKTYVFLKKIIIILHNRKAMDEGYNSGLNIYFAENFQQ